MIYELPALNSAGYNAVTIFLRTIDNMPELKNISVARTRRITDKFEIITEDLRNKKNQVILNETGKYDASKAIVENNKLNRIFDINVAPCRFWCADITEIKTDEDKVYMCAIIDLCGRYLIGYSFGKRMDVRLVRRTVNSAVSLV